jgi:hypothetical protein
MRAGYSKGVTHDLQNVLSEVLPADAKSSLVQFPLDMSPYLETFLGQFRYLFDDSAKRRAASLWLAWLLVDVAKRNEPCAPQEQASQIDVEIEKALTTVAERIRLHFKEELGDDYAKFTAQIDEGIEWSQKTTLSHLTVLQNDPLYPAFKAVPSSESLEHAIESALRAGFPRYTEPHRMMTLKEELFVKRLQIFFSNVPQLFLFDLTINEIRPHVIDVPYLGNTLFSSMGTARDCYWPIEAYFRAIPPSPGKIRSK